MWVPFKWQPDQHPPHFSLRILFFVVEFGSLVDVKRTDDEIFNHLHLVDEEERMNRVRAPSSGRKILAAFPFSVVSPRVFLSQNVNTRASCEAQHLCDRILTPINPAAAAADGESLKFWRDSFFRVCVSLWNILLWTEANLRVMLLSSLGAPPPLLRGWKKRKRGERLL